MKTQSKNTHTAWSAGKRGLLGFSFTSDWLRKWREFSENEKTGKRENAGCLVLVIHLIGLESGASFLDQLQREVKQNQGNPGLLSTLFWKLLYLAISIIIIICSFVTHFAFQAGPIIESILQSYPDYIAVKDLPHDDTNYKVNLKFSPLFLAVYIWTFQFAT